MRVGIYLVDDHDLMFREWDGTPEDFHRRVASSKIVNLTLSDVYDIWHDDEGVWREDPQPGAGRLRGCGTLYGPFTTEAEAMAAAPLSDEAVLALAERVYALCNEHPRTIQDREQEKVYRREHRARSLSVGDLVHLDEYGYFAVASLGFTPVPTPR